MRLLVLDSNSIINRAFYGIRPLTTKDGFFTNGIYGFMNILNRLTEEFAPDGVVAAFDLRVPTFRHGMYAEYKAGRKGMPDELAVQMPVLKELLTAFGHTVLEREGYEADDILGTLAAACKRSGDDCVIATGDRDSLQLVDEGVRVVLAATKAGQPVTTVYDRAKIAEEYGVTPPELLEVKALKGDSSDNIPGVAGVGDKTALDLIRRFHTIKTVYSGLDELPIRDTLKAKLTAGRDSAFLSRRLGEICCEVPIPTDIPGYKSKTPDRSALSGILTGLEFFRLLDKIKLPRSHTPRRFGKSTQKPLAEAPGEEEKNVEVFSGNAEEILAAERIAALWTENGIEIAGEITLSPAAAAASLPASGGDRNGQRSTVDCKALPSETPILTDSAKALFKENPALNITFDSGLAGYILNPSASGYDLPRLLAEYGVPEPETESGAFTLSVSLFALERKMTGILRERSQIKLLVDMEIPLARVLAEMERTGFAADREGIAAYGETLAGRAGLLADEVFELVGYEFNLNSPKQLGEALFVKLGLPSGKKTKSGFSTDAQVLEELKFMHPAVEKLLEYRQLSKLKSTYCDGLFKCFAEDGRIHTTFNQTEARTGRISSLEPNLQNIPVRTPAGRELRRFFRAREDWVLCDADYSQIELRVLAHISGDRAMIDAFNRGEDIHTLTAISAFGVPRENITPEMRTRAKAVNFGIVYGIGAYSLARDLNVGFYDAKRYIEAYMSAYPAVADYMESVVKKAKETGWVSTMFGRRRYLPELAATQAPTRAFGERVARNAPIQGAAADIIKLAMNRVYARLKQEKLRSRLILQVHDELLVEAPPEEMTAACQILREEMEAACKLDVPLIADVHTGKTWYEAKSGN
ncbi:MAG: DNA polymerase I [Oscillospiraceae bacterium]|jgi:DNA polymerase-1|nr:DNA polymerase I [Oscillospiraceae bacterium]